MVDPVRNKVTLAYTSGPLLLPLVSKLTKKGCTVQIYNPPDPILDLKKFQADIKFVNKNAELQLTNSWSDVIKFIPDIILFLNLDVLPDISDEDFAQGIHSEMSKIKIDYENSMVIFGGNYRGLIAAECLIKASKVYEEDPSDSIRVISSINHAGQIVYPENNMGTIISMPEGNIFVIYDGEEEGPNSDGHKDLEVLGGKWQSQDFISLESDALVRAIVMYLETENFAELNLIGRSPTKQEKSRYELADGLTWLNCDDNSISLQAGKGTLLKMIKKVSARVEEVSDSINVALSDVE